MQKKYLFLLSSLLLGACSSAPTITGAWVQPVPGQAQAVQGFELQEGGKAASINMATLQYETWQRQENTLTLTGKSIGNGQTLSFTQEYKITQLDGNELRLEAKEGATMNFTRP